MHDCVFCKIISGEIPAYTYWEDEHTIAILDIEPKTEGHSLVIPKIHSETFLDMSSAEWATLSRAAQTVAQRLKDATRKQRVCVVVEGFAVHHTHIHLIPADTPEEFATPAKKGNPETLRALQTRLQEHE